MKMSFTEYENVKSGKSISVKGKVRHINVSPYIGFKIKMKKLTNNT